MANLILGDCRKELPRIPDNTFTGIVTDPPYELLRVSRNGSGRNVDPDNPFGRHGSRGRGFMGLAWDATGVPFRPEVWAECLRVCKPGSFLLAFGGTRTVHRLTCAIEDAGWSIRDQISYLFDPLGPCSPLLWIYGQGMSKSLDISKAIDERAGAAREAAPVTELAHLFAGYGTALKPAVEPIVVAMKPAEGSYAENAAKHGLAGLNLNACSVPFANAADEKEAHYKNQHGSFNSREERGNLVFGDYDSPRVDWSPTARLPANLIHDGSDLVLSYFNDFGPKDGGHYPSARGAGGISVNGHKGQSDLTESYVDEGSAARFFYCAKASTDEREIGLFGNVPCYYCHGLTTTSHQNAKGRTEACRRNDHPTVKPLSLCEYLARLIAPPKDGHILDPFMGSGRSGMGAVLNGCQFTGIELEERSLLIARHAIAWAEQNTQLKLFTGA